MATRPGSPSGGNRPAPEGPTVAEERPLPPAVQLRRSAPAMTLPPGPWPYRLAVGCLVVALAGLGISSTEIAWQLLPRNFTPAQQQQIINWEVGKRWRTWPAGRIFPAVVAYRLPATDLASEDGLRLSAHRAGIAPQASCQSAVGPVAGQALARQGCLIVLRATYTDSTGAFAVTVGVAVLPGPAQASRSLHAMAADPAPGGVRAVRFRHTLAAGFGDAARQNSTMVRRGPYVIMSTVGYADGRHHVRSSADPYAKDEMLSVVRGVSSWIGARLGAQHAGPPGLAARAGPAPPAGRGRAAAGRGGGRRSRRRAGRARPRRHGA